LYANHSDSESGLEAVRYQERLVDCVQKLIADASLAPRLGQLEDTFDARSSIVPRQRSDADTEVEVDVDDDELPKKATKAPQEGILPTFSNRGELVYELSRSKLDERVKHLVDKNDISEPIFIMSTHRRNTVDLPTARILHLGVEPVLFQSRVYRRCASNAECDQSFASSLARTPWSIFSGFSLADISILSVVALPISVEETAKFQQILVTECGDDGTKTFTPITEPQANNHDRWEEIRQRANLRAAELRNRQFDDEKQRTGKLERPAPDAQDKDDQNRHPEEDCKSPTFRGTLIIISLLY